MTNKKLQTKLIHLITKTSNSQKINVSNSIDFLIKELQYLKSIEKYI